MPRQCSVCAHADRDLIDRAIVGGSSLASVAKTHNLTGSSLSRHRDGHVSAALTALSVEERTTVARSLLEEVQDLIRGAKRLMVAAEQRGASQSMISAMAETRKCIELHARLTGELDERPQTLVVNLQSTAEWITLRSRMLSTLERFPEARTAVIEAIGS